MLTSLVDDNVISDDEFQAIYRFLWTKCKAAKAKEDLEKMLASARDLDNNHDNDVSAGSACDGGVPAHFPAPHPPVSLPLRLPPSFPPRQPEARPPQTLSSYSVVQTAGSPLSHGSPATPTAMPTAALDAAAAAAAASLSGGFAARLPTPLPSSTADRRQPVSGSLSDRRPSLEPYGSGVSYHHQPQPPPPAAAASTAMSLLDFGDEESPYR